MNDTIRRDIRKRPDLFLFQEPLQSLEADAVIEHLNPPSDLLAFWREFGWGEAFESEDFLNPRETAGESIAERTAELRAKGLPNGPWVFLEGAFLSTFNGDQFEVRNIDSLQLKHCFNSFEDWYNRTLRHEFAARYGL